MDECAARHQHEGERVVRGLPERRERRGGECGAARGGREPAAEQHRRPLRVLGVRARPELAASLQVPVAQPPIALREIAELDEQILDRAYARERVEADRDSFIIVGDSDAADIRILAITQTDRGLNVTLEEAGETVTLFAPLYGTHHGRNMALTYALARHLGIARDRIVTAMRSTPQIAHRLEIKRPASGVIYLDDAYNSNPAGFANALDLMQTLKTANGRRILVTPGMAELGAKHDEDHLTLGRKAADTVDIALVVKPERIPTFLDGLKSGAAGGQPPEVHTFETFAEARAWLDTNEKAGDVVLIENDLPDLYERTFPT